MAEKVNTSATAATGTIDFNVIDGAIQNFTSNASANFTFNLRGNATVSLDTLLDTGESVTVAHIVQQGSTAYYSKRCQIDGSVVTPLNGKEELHLQKEMLIVLILILILNY
jgi:hypothetical protein